MAAYSQKKPSNMRLTIASRSFTSRNNNNNIAANHPHQQPLLSSSTTTTITPPIPKSSDCMRSFNDISTNKNATNNLDIVSNSNTNCSKSELNICSTTSCGSNLRIAVIGSSKVGKTHLIQQLINCQPPSSSDTQHNFHQPVIAAAATSYPSYPLISSHSNGPVSKLTLRTAKGPTIYYPIVIFNDHLYNVTLIDCPCLDNFPIDSLQDWSFLGGHNIRDAHGFILVFDVASESSFQYIKSIRDQMIQLGIEAPIVIAANKVDLLATNGKFLRNNKREMSAIVKKHWKGSILIECSSKYNWRVLSVFKELMRLIDSRDSHPKQTAARAMHNALRHKQCCIM